MIVAGACGIAAGTPLAILERSAGRRAREPSSGVASTSSVSVGWTRSCSTRRGRSRSASPASRRSRRSGIGIRRGCSRPRPPPSCDPSTRLPEPSWRLLARGASSRESPRAFLLHAGRGVEASAGRRVGAGRQPADHRGSRNRDPRHAPRAAAVKGAHGFRLPGGACIGAIRIEYRVRPEARRAVDAMQAMAIRTILMTGDAAPPPRLSRRSWRRGGRSRAASRLQASPRRRARRGGPRRGHGGDGVNDVPALMEATSVWPWARAPTSRRRARTSSSRATISRSSPVRSRSRAHAPHHPRNFVATLGVDAVGIGLAAVCVLSPLPAAFVHVASELAFILNSACPLPSRSRARPAGESRPR